MVQVLRKENGYLYHHKMICLGVTSKFKPFYLRVLGGLMVLETDPDNEVPEDHFESLFFFLSLDTLNMLCFCFVSLCFSPSNCHIVCVFLKPPERPLGL